MNIASGSPLFGTNMQLKNEFHLLNSLTGHGCNPKLWKTNRLQLRQHFMSQINLQFIFVLR